jgi:hypothetical protein
MPKRSSRDINETAFATLQQVIGQVPKTPPAKEKNPAAVALGRLGGIKGGNARAAKLTRDQRRTIAIKAAKARWNKKR